MTNRTPRNRRPRFSCEGKAKLTEKEAYQAARSASRSTGTEIVAYPCRGGKRACGWWHTGHQPGAPSRAAAAEVMLALSTRVASWLLTRFGLGVLASRQERAARVLEEAAELAQAEGLDLAQADRILVRVFSRPIGDPSQEAAGVMVTMLAWAHVATVDLLAVAEAEVQRIEGLPIEHFRRKHAEKAAAGTALAGTPPLEAA